MRPIALPSTKLVSFLPAGVAALVLSAVWGLGTDANPGPIGFRIDDAWIHMVYGRSLATEGLLAYNPGAPSTGATSPLWAGLLGLLHAALGERSTDNLVWSVLGLGAILHVALVHSSSQLIHQLTSDRKAALVGALALGLSPQAAAAALSGMEVTLTALTLVVGLRLFLSKKILSAGLLLALAAAARPEGAVVGVLVFGYWAFSCWAPSKPVRNAGHIAREGAALVAPAVLIGGAIVGWNLWASGAPLPASFYVKEDLDLLALGPRFVAGGLSILAGLSPLGGGVTLFLLWGLCLRPVSVSSVGPVASRGARALPLAAAVVLLLANLITVNPIDPAAWYHIRYLLPVLPLLVIASAIGVSTLDRVKPGLRPLALGAFLVVALVQSGLTLGPVSHHLHNDTRNINEVQREIGTWLRGELKPGTWIASSDAGAVRYFSGLPTIDLLGLNTPLVNEGPTAWSAARPVERLVLLPTWFRPRNLAQVAVLHQAKTDNYSVTSNPAMAQQLVLACRGEDGETVLLELEGNGQTVLSCTAGAPLLNPSGAAEAPRPADKQPH